MISNSRRDFIKQVALVTGSLCLHPKLALTNPNSPINQYSLTVSDFGKDFVWGAATAAFQTEGACGLDGKGRSIWDTFTETRNKIRNNDNARVATDFYHRYGEDISLLKNMNFNAFRFSLSWPRIIPNGTGPANQKGIDFYNRVIDTCLLNNITPWITLYHWDLPQVLENKGGWTNRDVVNWFSDYCECASHAFGDRVKHWIILNEPMAFTAFGYLMGKHAPGKRGLHNFLPTIHHAALCQSLGSGIVKSNVPDSEVGTTFSCSPVEPYDQKTKNVEAAKRLDAAVNRLFIEPALGMGYPVDTLPFLNKLEKYFKPDDDKLLEGNYDFIGIQNYFRLVAKYSIIPPLHANQVEAIKRNVPINSMNMEVYPKGISTMLERFSAYKKVKKIYITESGVCYKDIIKPDGSIEDNDRIVYFKNTLEHVLSAKNNGIPVAGYFVWSLTDNFEWAEGYNPRFGLVYIDYTTQKRILKNSGKWFRNFLENK